MEVCDLLIIGGGPAGLTAAIYGVRGELETIVLESEIPGGQMNLSGKIENYPGFESITGYELSLKIKKHAESCGAVIKSPEMATEINFEDNYIIVKSEKEDYKAKSSIIASGVRPKELGVPGEKSLVGRGVSYCTVCDAPFFKDKKVVVVGRSMPAVLGALTLEKIASEVKLLVNGEKLLATAGESLMTRWLERSSVKTLWNTEVKEILGDTHVEGVLVKDKEKEYIIETDGVFIQSGKVPNSEIARKAGIKVDRKGFILVDEHMRTNKKGVFACGDVTGGVMQLTVAMGEATIAAINAYNYCCEFNRKVLGKPC
ncbi:MAG: NAD(P)/FAD-dependent oxidoreductase [Candidatus Hydrothermarchaeota archaeon]